MTKRKIFLVLVALFICIGLSVSTAQAAWYWKPGYPDYAPSGVPDFDQNQDRWGVVVDGGNGKAESTAGGDDIQVVPNGQPMEKEGVVIKGGLNKVINLTTIIGGDDHLFFGWCDVLAAANSLWWFDSKYELPISLPPPAIADSFPLVTSYNPGVWDDHDPQNVAPLVVELARYFRTDVPEPGETEAEAVGTYEHVKAEGINKYADDHGVGPTNHPGRNWWFKAEYLTGFDFKKIEEEVEHSEDVILSLVFYDSSKTPWESTGGHAVTVAGVNSAELKIALSDPDDDNAEAGGPGRVLPGGHGNAAHGGVPFTNPAYNHTQHNDAQNVSHDEYTVGPKPAGAPRNGFELKNYLPGRVTLVEGAVVVSPQMEEAERPKITDLEAKYVGGTIFEVTGKVSDNITPPNQLSIGVGVVPPEYYRDHYVGPVSDDNIETITHISGPDSSGYFKYRVKKKSCYTTTTIIIMVSDLDSQKVIRLLVLSTHTVGYNTFWLIVSTVSLMACGGYLLSRQRRGHLKAI